MSSSARVIASAFLAIPLSASPSVACPGWVTTKSSASALERRSSHLNECRLRPQRLRFGLARLIR